jgi:capsular polysaccharide export protein
MTGSRPRIAIFSPGLWKLGSEVSHMSGMEAALPGACAAVAGWGHKPTTRLARQFAAQFAKPYIRFEDGFLRSLMPGPRQKPVAMVMDRSGIYYDAHKPSDLETLIESGDVSEAERQAGLELVALVARHRLSKYNDGSDHVPEALRWRKDIVLLVDQTLGDQSVAGGLAGAESFRRMTEAAIAENPGAMIAVKVHPEVVARRKSGYLSAIAEVKNLLMVTGHVNPHALLDLAPKVYTVSSQLGFEALLRGCTVRCFGMPFYAGWGLTNDDVQVARRQRRASLADVAAAALIRYSRYFDCWTRAPIDAVTAADQLAFLRRQYFGNDRKYAVCGVGRWKQRAIAAMATGPQGPPSFHRSAAAALAEARHTGGILAAWGRQAAALRGDPSTDGIPVVAIEDGFLRSAGLGAAFTPPRSLVFDRLGIYYDPAQPSEIETLLADRQSLETERAGRLRRTIVDGGVTKYNLREDTALPDFPADREKVLVIGQVSDDAAVTSQAGGAGNINRHLLIETRRLFPEACVIFKPHPDVERLGRAGAIAAAEDLALADYCLPGVALTSLMSASDRVVTFSSLAGFEALLRGKPVTVLGLPFYAGWGLTSDLAVSPRRGLRLSIDELAAAALIHYPRYWDPESNLPCPPETVLVRLSAASEPKGPKAMALLLAGRVIHVWRRLRNAAIRSGISGGLKHDHLP